MLKYQWYHVHDQQMKQPGFKPESYFTARAQSTYETPYTDGI